MSSVAFSVVLLLLAKLDQIFVVSDYGIDESIERVKALLTCALSDTEPFVSTNRGDYDDWVKKVREDEPFRSVHLSVEIICYRLYLDYLLTFRDLPF